jgi:hypothetical protein
MESRSIQRFPDFVCIGAVKAGTTWFYRMFAEHPDVWLPPMKELHYFNRIHPSDGHERPPALKQLDSERVDAALRLVESALKGKLSPKEKIERIYGVGLIGAARLTDEWYARIFETAPAEAICGEVTPNYALLPAREIKHMLALQPRLKIVFILRDPIDRMWSHLKMRERRHGVDLEQHLKDLAGRKDMVPLSDYMATIERYQQFVPETNFLTLYFDSIVEEPARLLQETCEFLGLDFARGAFNRAGEAIHAGSTQTMPAVLYDAAREKLEPIYRRLLSLKHPVVNRWYERHYHNVPALD